MCSANSTAFIRAGIPAVKVLVKKHYVMLDLEWDKRTYNTAEALVI